MFLFALFNVSGEELSPMQKSMVSIYIVNICTYIYTVYAFIMAKIKSAFFYVMHSEKAIDKLRDCAQR